MRDADWPGILPDVLLALEADGYLPAETRRDHGREVRYGKHGSLSVDRRSAVYRVGQRAPDNGIAFVGEAVFERPLRADGIPLGLLGEHGDDLLGPRTLAPIYAGPGR